MTPRVLATWLYYVEREKALDRVHLMTAVRVAVNADEKGAKAYVDGLTGDDG